MVRGEKLKMKIKEMWKIQYNKCSNEVCMEQYVMGKQDKVV